MNGMGPEGRVPSSEAPHAPLRGGMALASLGVVFGDIGTSPLYSLQAVFAGGGHGIEPTEASVLGIVSLVLWTITVIVSFKYVGLVLRADHHGEGGILALASLTRARFATHPRARRALLAAGLAGACLFFGDSVATPAISVLSAVEGVTVARPGLEPAVVPVAVGILVALFLAQKFGTGRIGVLFGPVMAVWFACLALLGIPHLLAEPGILRAVSPNWAVGFLAAEPVRGIDVLGAVVLVVTGAEALYADVGHFGRRPIERAWFRVVFPALTVNYLGQGALLLADPSASANPFFRLAPSWAALPLTVLATIATVIASQAVISGTFSVARQAMRLGYLPPLRVANTSEHAAGQIYVPVVDGVLLASVIAVTVAFGSSVALAGAYGLAVTTTFVLTTVLLLVQLRVSRRWAWWRIIAAGVALVPLEVMILAGNTAKIVDGGWLPLTIAAIVLSAMCVWHWGLTTSRARVRGSEGTVRELLDDLLDDPPERIPGTAVFLHGPQATVPLALRDNLALNRTLHETTLLVNVHSVDVPHVPVNKRVTVSAPSAPVPGLWMVDIRYGFFDRRNVPLSLTGAARRLGRPELDPSGARFVLSTRRYAVAPGPFLRRWMAWTYLTLAKATGSPAAHFRLPEDRTVEIRHHVAI